MIVPILKPGKEAESPGSYRPIALTAVICKIMERMVTDRLVYRLEKKGFFSTYQNGFRLGRGTMDSILVLDDDIKKALVNKEVVVGVFFDIEKAYDMLWKEGVIIKLYDAGIRGRMINWIKDFLRLRCIQVRVGGSFSESVFVDNGTPQGSVISPVLFNIMVNNMFDEVGSGFQKSLFADDGALWKRGRNTGYLLKQIQCALNKVQAWSDKWGFRLSLTKTKYMVFGTKRNIESLGLKLYGESLERVGVFKFLGVWVDEKLTYKEHVSRMVSKCGKVINILRCLVGCSWGADRNLMLMIYKAMIRSVFDYGCLAYGSAARSTLSKLDVVQSRALRICTGAFRTTPILSLLVEAGEVPLRLRRAKLALNYFVKIKSSGSALPSFSLLTECWEFRKGESRLNRFSVLHSVKTYAEELKLNERKMVPSVYWPSIPHWIIACG